MRHRWTAPLLLSLLTLAACTNEGDSAPKAPNNDAPRTDRAFYGASAEEACASPLEPDSLLPAADSFVRLPTAGSSSELCLGPSAADATDLEQATVAEGGIQLTFSEAGIEAFNELARECFATTDVCVTQRIAIVLDGEVLIHPRIQAPSFGREDITISGQYDEAELAQLAMQIESAIRSVSNVIEFRPVMYDVPA